jgi:hypothetical protein
MSTESAGEMDLQEKIIAKYADKVSPEHRAAMEALGFAYQLLAQHREQFERLLESERYMHNVGALIDPSLYRHMLSSESFRQQTRVCTAAIAFLKEVGAVADEVAAPKAEAS